jgi:prepilin-type N-terminal cleavage/methylation domain-containing protein
MRRAQQGRKAAAALRRGDAGFTLVEILVVITIIGLIMAIVGPRVLNYLGESKVKAAKIQIESSTWAAIRDQAMAWSRWWRGRAARKNGTVRI